MLSDARHLAVLSEGVGIWGINIPVAWGFAIMNFVWWIGIGHAGTLISAILAAAEAGLANFHQSLRGSHDAVRGGLRRHVSDSAPGASLAGLLAAALSELDVAVAAVPQPAGLGRVRGIDLRDGLAAVLVRRTDPRSRHHARPRAQAVGAERLRHAGAWAGAARPDTGSAIRWHTCCWPGWPRRWWSRCTPWSASISQSPSCPAGTPRFFRPTSSRAPSSPALPWC